MIWFFERERSRLHYEIRRQTDGDAYELVITWPDGRQEIERYSECGTLTERSTVLESQLADLGWAPPQNGVRPPADTPVAIDGAASWVRRRCEG